MLTVTLAAIAMLNSAEVHKDRTVTFRYKDVNAKKVEVNIESFDPQPMAKDKDGIWSFTTKPLDPDLYGYTFNADGETRLDPQNPSFKPNLIWQSNVVLVPGNQLWEVRDVPHGALHRHFYHSKVVGEDRDYYVYTPPNYSAKAKYPVLYLLHGFSDMANGWTAVGQAHTILDNLIAEGKAKPMIVVMPLGYGVKDFASPASANFRDAELTKKNFSGFREALLTEVMPRVEKDYPVTQRAIAGLSMGGAESLYVGLNHPEKFPYIGAFSSGGLPSVEFALDKFDAKKKPKLLWMACGTEDGLIGFSRGFVEELKKRGLSPIYTETKGRHVWMLWRRNLADFAQKLFR